MSVTVTFNHNAVMKKVNSSVSRSIGDVALEVANRAKLSMKEPKSGRTYAYRRRVGSGVKFSGKSKHAFITYKASAPGEPPAVRSGRLWGSVEAIKVADGVWHVGSNVDYAAKLELGGDRVAPRPFLKPACEKAGVIAAKIFAKGEIV